MTVAHLDEAAPPERCSTVSIRAKPVTLSRPLRPACIEASAVVARVLGGEKRIGAVARALGIARSKVSRWGSPASEESPSLARLRELVDVEPGLVAAVVDWLGALLEQRQPSRLCPSLHAINAAAALGDVARITRAALADGRLTEEERAELRKVWRRASAVCRDALADLDQGATRATP